MTIFQTAPEDDTNPAQTATPNLADADISKITELIITTTQKTFDKIIARANKKTEEAIKSLDSKKIELDDLQTRIIEILGIFVALFTFVSVNIGLFNSDKNLSLTSLSGIVLILLGSLVIFIILLDLILRQQVIKYYFFLLIPTLFIVIGIFLIMKNDNDQKKYTTELDVNSLIELNNKKIKECTKKNSYSNCL